MVFAGYHDRWVKVARVALITLALLPISAMSPVQSLQGPQGGGSALSCSDAGDIPSRLKFADVAQLTIRRSTEGFELEVRLRAKPSPFNCAALYPLAISVLIDYDSKPETGARMPLTSYMFVPGVDYCVTLNPLVAGFGREGKGGPLMPLNVSMEWSLFKGAEEVARRRYRLGVWAYARKVKLNLPSSTLKMPGSRLICKVVTDMGVREFSREPRKLKVSQVGARWTELLVDDYDGLPFDIMSVQVRRVGYRLWIRYRFYSPSPRASELGPRSCVWLWLSLLKLGNYTLIPVCRLPGAPLKAGAYVLGLGEIVQGSKGEVGPREVTFSLDLSARPDLLRSRLTVDQSGWWLSVEDSVPNEGWFALDHGR